MIFDTHAHYDDEAFEEDREALLESLKDGGIAVSYTHLTLQDHPAAGRTL